MNIRKQMRAAVITGPGQAEVVEAPVPAPKSGELLIRIEGCGVCASNLAPWAGPDWMRFPTAPGALGHEAWGVVEEIGPDTDGFTLGDRVTALSFAAYAEYDLADGKAAVRLPPSLDGRPVPGEPLGCALNVFRRSAVARGDTVVIVGVGFLGALLTALCVSAGARVIALSRRAFARDVAAAMGAQEALPFEDRWSAAEAVRGALDGKLAPRVIEAVGSQSALDLASDLTAEGGRLVIAGYHQDGPRRVDMQQWNWRGFDVINAHERDPEVCRRGLREAVGVVESGALDPSVLCTHRFGLEDLGVALDMTRDRPDGFMKAWIAP